MAEQGRADGSGVDGIVADGPGLAAAGGSDNTGADDAEVESIDDTPAALAPEGKVTKKRRARRKHTGQDARKCLRRAASLPVGRSGAPGPPPPDGGDGDNLVFSMSVRRHNGGVVGRGHPRMGGASGVVVDARDAP